MQQRCLSRSVNGSTMKRILLIGVVALLVIAVSASTVLAAVSSVGTIPDPGHPAGRSPQVPYAGAAVPVIVAAPSSVVQEAYTSSTEIRVFDEQQNVLLANPLQVDQTVTTPINSPATIPAGTVST